MRLHPRTLRHGDPGEQTLAAVSAATARTDALIDRINGITTKAKGVVLAAHETVGAAAAAIEQANAITATAAPLLASYSEPLRRLDQSRPDLNQLLDNVSDLDRMAGRIPKVFRRRP